MFKNSKIKNKLIFLSTIVTVCIMFSSGLMIFRVVTINSRKEMRREMTSLADVVSLQIDNYIEAVIQNYLRGRVASVYDMMEYYYSMTLKGEMSEEEAKQKIQDLILEIKIADTGYMYAIDSNGLVKIHPKISLVNTDISNYDFIQEQLKIKKGYLSYKWKNPDEKEEKYKVIYMMKFEPWDLIVSASSYEDEFFKLIDLSKLKEFLLSIKIGQTGYPYLVDGNGIVKVHPWLEGVNIVKDYTDSKGNYVFKKLLDGDEGSFSYSWIEQDGEVRFKILNYKKLRLIDWVIGVSTYEDEFLTLRNKINFIILVSTVIGLISFIISFYIIGDMLSVPIKATIIRARKLADLNLDIDFDEKNEKRQDEIGMLENSFKLLIGNLNKIVKEMKERAEKITISVEDLEKNNEDLANSSHNQVLELEKTVFTIGGINSIIGNHLDKTLELGEKMNDTENKAAVLSEISKVLRRHIYEIKESSIQISSILNILNEISFQTNILALNAAVEAANSDRDNKGFEAITSEIRTLSKKSKEAANEIENIIDNNHAKILEGESLVESVSKELEKIMLSIKSTNSEVQELAFGANAQQQGIEEINGAVSELNEIAQLNFGISKESAQIAENLNIEYFKLLEIIKMFKEKKL